MSKKKVILAVVLPVMITIVFALAKVTTPPQTIVEVSIAAFFGSLLGNLWVRKRYNLSFGRMTLIAVVVAGVAAAMMVISNLLARILPSLRH